MPGRCKENYFLHWNFFVSVNIIHKQFAKNTIKLMGKYSNIYNCSEFILTKTLWPGEYNDSHYLELPMHGDKKK